MFDTGRCISPKHSGGEWGGLTASQLQTPGFGQDSLATFSEPQVRALHPLAVLLELGELGRSARVGRQELECAVLVGVRAGFGRGRGARIRARAVKPERVAALGQSVHCYARIAARAAAELARGRRGVRRAVHHAMALHVALPRKHKHLQLSGCSPRGHPRHQRCGQEQQQRAQTGGHLANLVGRGFAQRTRSAPRRAARRGRARVRVTSCSCNERARARARARRRCQGKFLCKTLLQASSCSYKF